MEVPPDFLKFDIGLVRNIQNATAERQKMLGSLVQMVKELGIAALAEGIELPEEHEVCSEIGFEYAQGYLYGRPALPKTFVDQVVATPGPHTGSDSPAAPAVSS